TGGAEDRPPGLAGQTSVLACRFLNRTGKSGYHVRLAIGPVRPTSGKGYLNSSAGEQLADQWCKRSLLLLIAAAGTRVDKEAAWLLPYYRNVTLALLEQAWVPASHTL